MNIKELKEAIANLPDDMEVTLQDDPEGNGYRFARGVEEVVYQDMEYIDCAYSLDNTADDNCMTEEEWEEVKSYPHSIVIYP